MTTSTASFGLRLFHSYCHSDNEHQLRLETQLAQLKQEGLLQDWSDRRIIPGTPSLPL